MCQTKTCTKCKIEKPLSEFRRRKKSVQSWCKDCHAEYAKERYKQKPEYYKHHRQRGKKRRVMMAQLKLREYLEGKKCADCGESDIVVLTFDHMKDLGPKEFDISTAVSSGMKWERIQEEIAKCVVRCCNCHQRKTAKDRGYYKLTDIT
jgi:hypothetical protein